MSILAALAASTRKEVRVGVITWRLKRISGRDMMEHGIPGILLLKEIVAPAAVAAARAKDAAAADQPPPSKGRPEDPNESAAAKMHRQLLRATDGQKAKMEQATRHFEELVCASVTHVRVDGQFEEGSEHEEGDPGGWVSVRVVPNEKQQDPSNDIIWVGSMPPGTVDKLQPQVMQLSAPAEVQASLQRFCREPEPASDDSTGV